MKRLRFKLKAPLCRNCVWCLHVPLTAGYCRRWFSIKNGLADFSRCVDARIERCGVSNPKSFKAREAA